MCLSLLVHEIVDMLRSGIKSGLELGATDSGARFSETYIVIVYRIKYELKTKHLTNDIMSYFLHKPPTVQASDLRLTSRPLNLVMWRAPTIVLPRNLIPSTLEALCLPPETFIL